MTEGVNPHSCSKFLAKVSTSIVGITSSPIEILHVISLFYEEFTPLNQSESYLVTKTVSIQSHTSQNFPNPFIMLREDMNLTVARV